jgi:hypothetical protein
MFGCIGVEGYINTSLINWSGGFPDGLQLEETPRVGGILDESGGCEEQQSECMTNQQRLRKLFGRKHLLTQKPPINRPLPQEGPLEIKRLRHITLHVPEKRVRQQKLFQLARKGEGRT